MIKIWNGHVEIQNPVRCWATNALGTLGPTYTLVGQPLGVLPDFAVYVVWTALAVVLVRIAAFAVLVHMFRTEKR